MRRTIDVREYPEYAGGHIAGAELVPLGKLDRSSEGWDPSEPLVLICKSGRRAEAAQRMLERKGFRSVEVLAGGMDAWENQDQPIVTEESAPWSMERQVRIVAGSLVVVFVALGFSGRRKSFVGAGLIGAGLIYAGVSNTCMMGTVLGKMPWNQTRRGNA